MMIEEDAGYGESEPHHEESEEIEASRAKDIEEFHYLPRRSRRAKRTPVPSLDLVLVLVENLVT